ncbi:GNAT family N-acetyltransferase [Streptomyces sp. NPDC090445]|uniref:GNAT family N-acetyltransferase n=1 Tax=Streptomyces sp. NPDC090445 TaxID=3365963 RepID=UPI0037FA1478
MMRLERLRADHADALLAFERENRAYFARFVPDRGAAYFTDFAARHRALLAEQDAGACHFHVVLAGAGAGGGAGAAGSGGGELVGRVNLVDAVAGSAELGYRIGERAAGRGLATAAVAEVCRLAAGPYGLSSLTAVADVDNPASRAVLTRNGFTETGRTTADARPAVTYTRRLTPRP